MNNLPGPPRPTACSRWLSIVICLFLSVTTYAQPSTDTGYFDVTMERPDSHLFHVTFRCPTRNVPTLALKIPACTPGYYPLMNCVANVSNLRATNEEKQSLS